MIVLATYNIKGGVGKTAAAVNLAHLAAREGARVLLWDLDPQGAASFYFRVKPKVKGGTKKLLKKGAAVEERIRGTDFPGLDLLPADFSYRHMDIVLDQTKKPTRRLAKLLASVGEEYDYAFLDCPPSISLVSEAVFGAADALLVPIIPTTLSLRTLEQILAFREKSGLGNPTVMPFFSMVDRRKRLHREILEALPAERSELLGAYVPSASAVERMGVQRRPLAAYAPRCAAARAYEDLWREIAARVER